MRTLARDLRFALRSMVHKPGFAIIIVITLAVGIGANAAVFSMVDALILHPFPIPEIDRLVMLYETVPQRGTDRGAVAPANFLDWQRRNTVFDDLVAFEWWDVNITGGEIPERIQGTYVTPGFLDILGVVPFLGRTLRLDAENPDARTAVLSHELWSRRFAEDPEIVGTSVLLDGERYDIVGVAQKDFNYPNGTEVWAPLRFDAQTAALRDSHYLEVIGRVREGVSSENVEAEMAVLAEQLATEYPATSAGRGVRAMPLATAVVDIGVPSFVGLWQVTVIFVLLIACVNVANLLLAQGSERQKEFSLQLALGASRFRVMRQLLTENLLLSAMGALAALPLAWIATDLLRHALPPHIQRFVVGWNQIGLDWRVLAFTAAVTVTTALIFGLLPALSASRPDLTGALKDGGRTGGSSGGARQRGRTVLVVAEVALALMLLVASGLSIRGTFRLMEADQGYDPDGLMTMDVNLVEKKYKLPESRTEFFENTLDRIRSSPEVVSADVANALPSSGNNSSRTIDLESSPIAKASDRPSADIRVITNSFFDTMRIPLVQGRVFDARDRGDSIPVAIVSERFAERSWPGQDPLGQRFRAGAEGDEPWLTVVGVSGDVLHDWFLREPQPTFYRPLAQAPRYRASFVVRVRGEPTGVTPTVRTAVLEQDPAQPIFNLRTMNGLLAERLLGVKMVAVVMALSGVIALLLAAVGIYGLIAYAVSRRTHEFGLRVALGASRGDVLQLTASQAVKVTAAGVGIGLPIAYVMGRAMASALHGVVALDPWTYLALAVALTAVSLVAGYVPARRALDVDPAIALRTE